jgi:hypothetical protein
VVELGIERGDYVVESNETFVYTVFIDPVVAVKKGELVGWGR